MAPRLVHDLLERRVPHYAALYLGGCWVLIEFLAFTEDRYLLSPHLTNFALLLLALLLPSVLLFSYYHGRPGADRWARMEKIGIPLNFIVTGVILFMVFGGQDLGAVTTTVVVEDEDGNMVERVIAKGEFRKRIALFPLRVADAGDAGWLGEAVLWGLVSDLYQDPFIDMRVPPHFIEQLKEAGLSDAALAPRALKRNIAAELHMGHFVDGTVARTDAGYRLELALRDVKGGGGATRVVEGNDFFALIDSASVQIRRDLDLPARHLEDHADVPVSEMSTESVDAFRHYAVAVRAWLYDTEYETAAAELERALEIDPTFAAAAFLLYQIELLRGDAAAAQSALVQAMDHQYRLPERSQFAVKAEYYAMQQDMPKAFAVHEMRAEFYPQDVQAQLALAEIRKYRDDLRGAIAALDRALELDPTQAELLRSIGELYVQVGELDRGEEYYGRYVEQFPDRPEPYLSLANVQLLRAQHDAARESYEKALLLDPENVAVLIDLAELDRYVADWTAAEQRHKEALEAARTPRERDAALTGLQAYYSWRGDHVQAARYQDQALEQTRAHQPPVIAIQRQILGLSEQVRAGFADQALGTLDSLAAQLPPPVDALVPFGRALVWIELEEPDSLRAAVEAAESVVQNSGFQVLERNAVYARGRLHELRREWAPALEAYRREAALSPSDASIPAQLGRIHLRMGDFDEAERLILQTLTVWPSHARSNYELGLVYMAMGRYGDAIPRLEQSLDTWAHAQSDHARAVDARINLREARSKVGALQPTG